MSRDKIYKAAVISLLTVLATKHFFAKNYIPLLNSDEKTEKKGIKSGKGFRGILVNYSLPFVVPNNSLHRAAWYSS